MTQMTVPEPARFVMVTTVGDIVAGNVLAARLRAEGIEVRVHSPALGPYPMTVGEMAATELWVLSDRVEEARSILLDAEINDVLAPLDPDAPPMARRPDPEMRFIALTMGTILVGLFVLAIIRVY